VEDVPRLDPFVTEGLGDSSYLLASGDEAVVVDPQRDVGRILAAAASSGRRILAVLETHVHNDYVSGAHEIRDATGAELLLPARGRYAFDHRPMDEGDEIQVGDLLLRALETPGHTPEHLAWLALLGDDARPWAVFTGGSLMAGSAGRTDLLGPDRADALTRDQFASLHRLAELPDDVRVLPTHGAGSFCGSAGGGSRRTSTIGVERTSNPVLASSDLEAFVADRLSGLPEYPAYYRFMAGVNREGPALLRDLAEPVSMDPADLERALGEGVRLVDGRDRLSFSGAHVPGSLNIELDDQFGTYLGWLVPWNEPVAVIVPEPQVDALAEALVQARRIGFDRVVGFLDGGVDAWSSTGRAVSSYGTANVDDVCDAIRTGAEAPTLVDVRQPGEWADGTVPGSRTIFVADLPARLGEAAADGETWVICRTGHRASIAASLLDAAGKHVRLVTPGGVPAVLAACAPAT
jgi:hydroxyacylglutathione hydrolase